MSYLTISTDTLIVAGQSNNSGRGTSNQAWTPQNGLTALLFGNDYTLKTLADPTDSDSGQIDTVSSDAAAAGSIWPLVANLYQAEYKRRLLIVPCAKGGTSIVSWLPGVDHQNRATLYGSMVYRALRAGGTLRAVTWWQGATDAINQMTQATYNGHLDIIANAIYADLGIPTIACKMQNSSGIPDVDEARINDAIGEAWGDNANVLQGPDFTDIGSDDSFHLQSNEKLATAAARWFATLQAVL